MSLAKIKAKEAKGKQKMLPKLKAILANPNKTKCPILNEQELEHFGTLLQNAIKTSKLEPKCFATQNNICLGLESSLRNINNQKSSCIFISLSIKPNHIVGLIARNAEVKDETQPVFAQPKLEEFIEQIFGIQALCMVLPKGLLAVSEEIHKWVEARKKPKKVKNVSKKVEKRLKTTIKKRKSEQVDEKQKYEEEEETGLDKQVKSWSEDFISFSKNDKVELDSLKLNDDQAAKALSEIIDKIPSASSLKPKSKNKCEAMNVDVDTDFQVKHDSNVLETEDVSENSDDFLSDEYKALTVHKIKGNPNKNPKKKRKKNKKKNLGK